MKRRNNVDIMADILRVARGGAKKTWFVYRANLNFKIVKDYLSELIEKGLLAVHKRSNIYRTTERGLEFLEQYDRFRKSYMVVAERSFSSASEGTWASYLQYIRR